jgi:hypothetical protein
MLKEKGEWARSIAIAYQHSGQQTQVNAANTSSQSCSPKVVSGARISSPRPSAELNPELLPASFAGCFFYGIPSLR